MSHTEMIELQTELSVVHAHCGMVMVLSQRARALSVGVKVKVAMDEIQAALDELEKSPQAMALRVEGMRPLQPVL